MWTQKATFSRLSIITSQKSDAKWFKILFIYEYFLLCTASSFRPCLYHYTHTHRKHTILFHTQIEISDLELIKKIFARRFMRKSLCWKKQESNLLHFLRSYRVSRFQSTDAEVVNNFFNFFHVIFESVKTFSKGIVLEIQQAKSSVEFVYKSSDFHGTIKITVCHAVYSKTSLKRIFIEFIWEKVCRWIN